ncbi:MAG: hypothetical protein J2P34_06115, partial [Actinobacteria bacterium]|nr:hypothetical protein [Actinomycetota bacterium]
MTGDDPLPGERAAAMAGAAAEAVRGLNHAAGEDGIGRPSAAYDILGSLSLAASRPGQAPAGGALGCDAGGDPAAPVAATGISLDQARLSAAAQAG